MAPEPGAAVENLQALASHRTIGAELISINMDGLGTDEIYGHQDGNVWVDGLLTAALRRYHGLKQRAWLVLYGGPDTFTDEHVKQSFFEFWEGLNTVLDDNKMLCLPTGERLKLWDHVSFIW